MVIEFVSLYLGLLLGVQPVALSVAGEVAAVELRLDGEAVATLEGEPWRATVDFGRRLRPRRLVAVARGADGAELGRATQLVNLPRPTAEAGAVLERVDGRVVAARLTWQSVADARPRQVTATFDGEPLAVEDPARIPLPPHDADGYHLLVVDLAFSDRDRVQVVAGFGGAYADASSTELTAVPVTVRGRRGPPARALVGAVRRGDEAVPVLSAERGPADILFVRDHAADRLIERIGARDAREVGGYGVSSATGMSEGAGGITGMEASSFEALRRTLTLDGSDRVRMIWPATKRVLRDDVRMDLFPASPVFDADEGVFWALTHDLALAGTSDVQRLADAVAVAGLAAAADNRRRAVVLVLGPDPEDASRFAPDQVRDFLDALRVPLYVWTVGEQPDAVPGAWRGTAGSAEIGSLLDLRRAVRALVRDLARQRILWVEGRYLPQELTVATGEAVGPLLGS